MGDQNVVRVWEDPEYRSGLSVDELATLPEDPAGGIELSDAELGQVVGGAQSGASTGCNTKTCTRGNSQNPCAGCQA